MSVTLAVLFGGQSHEHPVSLMSATSVLTNLDPKYNVYMVGITMDGRWYHYSGAIADIENGNWENNENNEEVILSPSPLHHGFYNLVSGNVDKVDVIFPVLHGRWGEDGTIQGLCELNHIPCVSCDTTTSAASIDKEVTHIICEHAGVPMAKYMALHRNDEIDYPSLYKEVESKLGIPCYVKPSKEGSSFGAHKVKNYDEFVEYIKDAFSYDRKILLEEFIDGTEVGCGVLGYDEVASVYEVVVETEMYGFTEKYDGFKTNIYVPAKTLSLEKQQLVQKLSLDVYKAMGCDLLARVDFFNSSQGLIFNELNLIPGFTSHSLYPATFKGAGKSYTELLNNLVDLALKGRD